MKDKIQRLKELFASDTERNIFSRFIDYIRFPLFKNFDENLRVNFTYPITFLVGPNGTGKSSILHALKGAPDGESIEEFWFSTSLDKIKDQNCFIYSFRTHKTKTQVEGIKTRIRKRDKQGRKKRDYWEPSRPLIKYGMKKMPTHPDPDEASQTRWKLLRTNVYYIDFRQSLSAYDVFFYFGKTPKSKTLQKKQDVVRKHSNRLKRSYETDKEEDYYKIYRTKNIKTLGEKELGIICRILGKSYSEAKTLTHNLYSQYISDSKEYGFSTRLKTEELQYSEACSGSGESAIVRLVTDILSVEKGSLILLDEPETSLHPYAQRKLLEFLIEQSLEKKLQIVISTHSPDLIDGMPPESIKVLYEEKKVRILEDVVPELAFTYLGRLLKTKKVLVVEDELAKMVIDAFVKELNYTETCEVTFYPSGETNIKKDDIRVRSKEVEDNHFYIFDGDAQGQSVDPDSFTDADREIDQMEKHIENLIKFRIKFDTDSRRPEQAIELMEKYIRYFNKRVFFLPKDTPEILIWDDDYFDSLPIEEKIKQEIVGISDYKKKYNRIAGVMFSDTTSDTQKSVYRMFLTNWLKKKNSSYNRIVETVENVMRTS
jgi:predicted ATPase